MFRHDLQFLPIFFFRRPLPNGDGADGLFSVDTGGAVGLHILRGRDEPARDLLHPQAGLDLHALRVDPATQHGNAAIVQFGAEVVRYRRTDVDYFQEGAGDEDDVGGGGLGTAEIEPCWANEQDLVRGAVTAGG